MSERVRFSKRASKDILRIDRSTRARVRTALLGLMERPQHPNLDVRPLSGRSPWMRLRVGNVRVILRKLSASETRSLDLEAPAYLIARIVDRRDLEEAVKPL